MPSRVEREKQTIRKMIEIYCWKKHGKERGNLCKDCAELLNYAYKRLDLCPFGERKPSCKKCPIHCYEQNMRKRIKEVMKFSGPRMIIYAPWDWLRHEVREKFSYSSSRNS